MMRRSSGPTAWSAGLRQINRLPPLGRVCLALWVVASLAGLGYLLMGLPGFVSTVRSGETAERVFAWGPIDGFAEACAAQVSQSGRVMLIDPTGTTTGGVTYGLAPDVSLADEQTFTYRMYPRAVTVVGHVPQPLVPASDQTDYIAVWARGPSLTPASAIQQAAAAARTAQATLRGTDSTKQVCTYRDALGDQGVIFAVSPVALSRQAVAGQSSAAAMVTNQSAPTSASTAAAYVWTLLGLLALWVIGLLIFACMPGGAFPRGFAAAAALPVGCFAIALELVITSLVRVPWSWPWLAIPWVVLGLGLAWRHREGVWQPHTWLDVWHLARAVWSSLAPDEWSAAALLAAVSVGLWVGAPLWLPYGDGLNFTYFKARAFFVDGGMVSYYAHASTLVFSLPAHPPLLPLVVTWFYLLIGHVDEHATLLLWPALFSSMIAGFYALLRAEVRRRTALWCSVGLVLIASNLAQSALWPSYADMPLAVYLLLAGGLLWTQAPLGSARRAPLIVTGILLAAAAMTKEEAVPAALIVLIAAPLLSAVHRRGRLLPGLAKGWWRASFWAGSVFVLAYVPWLVFHQLHPTPEITVQTSVSNWKVETQRMLVILLDLSTRVPLRWGAALSLIVGWIVLHWGRGRAAIGAIAGRAWFLAVVIVLQVGVDVAGMATNPNDIHLEIAWTAGRLLEQLTPLVFLGASAMWPTLLAHPSKTRPDSRAKPAQARTLALPRIS